MGTIKRFHISAQLLKLDPRQREAAVLSENVGNAHRAAGEQEVDVVRGGKSSFNLSLPPGEFYRIKEQHKLQVGSFSVLKALEGTYVCLRVPQCSVLPAPGKIFL